MPSAYRHWGERSGSLDLDEEEDDRPPAKVPGPLIQALGEICDDPTTLKGLEASDTKFARLVEWLGRVREADGDQRIIVFSSFRRTISYLARRLQAAGFGVMELHGGIKDDRR